MHSGCIVDAREVRRGIQAAGAVTQYNVCAARAKHLHQRAQKRRMRSGGLLRFHSGDKVDLDCNAHSGCDPVKAADWRKYLRKRGAAGVHLIAFASGDADIITQDDPSKA